MKRFSFWIIVLALAVVIPVTAKAGVSINIGIALPPPIVFHSPPAVVVLPDTSDVYVVPDITAELFFWNGWWWRPWDGRWYRSRYYNRGWSYYSRVPSFYFDVDPGWRRYYRDRDWHGRRWDYRRIPDRQLRRNWRSWHNNRYWERHGTWGVRNYKPRPQRQRQELRHQRQEQYQRRPEVRRHQQRMREQQRRSQPRYKDQRKGESQHKKSQRKSGRDDDGRGR